jgi:hypothetical protein
MRVSAICVGCVLCVPLPPPGRGKAVRSGRLHRVLGDVAFRLPRYCLMFQCPCLYVVLPRRIVWSEGITYLPAGAVNPS